MSQAELERSLALRPRRREAPAVDGPLCRYWKKYSTGARCWPAWVIPRQRPQIPTAAIFASALMMCVTRLRSSTA